MKARLTVLAVALAAFGVVMLPPPPVLATEKLDIPLPLSVLLPKLLDNSSGCSAIQGPISGRLNAFCTGIPSGVSAGSGAPVSSEARASEAAIRGRTEGKRKGKGAAADGELGQGWGMFVTGDYRSLNKETSIFELGYEQNTTGGTAGLDYSGRLGILGAAFNYQHEFGDFAGQTGGYNNDLYSLILYGTWTPTDSLFVDLTAGYTRKQFNIDRRVQIATPANQVPIFLGRIEGDTHSNDFQLGARAGYDFAFGGLTIGPRAGVTYRESAIDGFRETGNTGIELIYGDQTIVSLTTNTGLFTSYAISTGFGVLVPQLAGEWIHEFENDQRSVPFTFVNAPAGTYRFLTEPADRDYFTVSAGAVLQLPGGLTPFVNYVEVLGQTRRAQRSATVGLRFGF